MEIFLLFFVLHSWVFQFFFGKYCFSFSHPSSLSPISLSLSLQKKKILVTVNGQKQPLLGTGAWSEADTILAAFTSALSAIQTGLGWTDKTHYNPACRDCLKNYPKQEFSSCQIHPPAQSHPWSTGTVIQSQYYQSTKLFISVHAPPPADKMVRYQLFPSVLRRIGDHCISSGSSFQVSIFICLLFAVDLFLHKEEFLGVDFDSFINNLMIMSGEYLVDGLVVKLKKKRTGSIKEKAGTLLMLFYCSCPTY
jgi:hypothetical protein